MCRARICTPRGVNVWSSGVYDPELDYVYLPTSTPTNNYYGGHRHGNNLFAETLVCLEAKTGTQIYLRRLHADRYCASPIVAAGRIYVIARDGTMSVVKSGRNFELLAANTLDDNFTASPAVSNGRLYLRGFRSLYAILARDRK